jgi:hypothetical protein
VSVKVTSNISKIELDVGTKSNLFVRFLLDEVEKISDPITPKKEGPLRQGTLKLVSGNQYIRRGTIIWLKEYAAAQEVGTTRGHPIKRYTTPGTGKAYALRGAQGAVLTAGTIMRKAGLF